MGSNTGMSALEFLERISELEMTMLDRAIGLLWHSGLTDARSGMTAREIAGQLHAFGYPEQNISRLERSLKDDRRTARARPAGWRVTPGARQELNQTFAFALRAKPIEHRDTVLPKELVAHTRGYIERVVEQINKSFDIELYDCTAVMCRRVLETLIIEVYEAKGEAARIKGADGQFMMFAGLLAVLEKDQTINLSRNGLSGLRDFKSLGDLSAHNRRFNARRPDIERIRDGLRVAVEELVHLAGFRSTAKAHAI